LNGKFGLDIGLLQNFFRRRSSPLLGIDISAAAIRIIELARLAHGWRVEHFALHELPRAAMREGGITQIAQMTDALREALHKSGTRLREAAIALPAGLVIRKTLTVPDGLSDEDLELQVEEEAAQSLSSMNSILILVLSGLLFRRLTVSMLCWLRPARKR
jgi:type IV pilus assembly protein PilM